MTAKEFAQKLNVCFVERTNEVEITNLLLDSRKIFDQKHSLFFAIKGNQHDGHLFVEDLITKGVSQFVVIEGFEIKEEWKVNFIIVDDTVEALQKIAQWHREAFELPIIAITGSNGKTIVKEWLSQLLESQYTLVKSPKSYNSQVGVPLSIWEINEEHKLGIFEAGISKKNEMHKLEAIIRPTLGILTNIGTAHDKGFVDKREKLQEKLQLFKGVETLVYSLEDSWLKNEMKSSYQGKTFTWGKDKDADVLILKIENIGSSTEVYYRHLGEEKSVLFPFVDTASLENGLHCLTMMLLLGLENVEDVHKLKSVSMRLEVKQGVLGSQLIDDTYNNDFLGLKIGIDFLLLQAGNQEKVLILSDLKEGHENKKRLYEKIAFLTKDKGIDYLVTVGEDFAQYHDLFQVPFQNFASTQELLQQLDDYLIREKTVLVKGARTFEFEKIIKHLEQKNHQTVFEVSLTALANNLNYLKRKLPEQTKTMAMVKAFGYGSGSAELIFTLQFHKVDYLAVAYVDEGITLREQGIKMPIMVMNPEIEAFEKMLTFDLEPEVYAISHLEALVPYINKPTKIHLKIDTGMHRLGFELEDLPRLILLLKENSNLQVASVFSHLVGADEEEHDAFTQKQISTFEKALHFLSKEISYPFLKHILNSAGIQRFSKNAYDMVRLGIALYGIGVNEEEQENLIPIGTLKSYISQIKTVKKGETIGYGRKGAATQDLKIATIAIGYADGFDRRFSRGVGQMEVRGVCCDVMGNVCMDMTMIDVTNVEGVSEGDEVIIFGGNLPIYQQAEKIGTIPYELLTSISSRVKRVFYTE
ncbi:MAG: bifunctional UDP-N-acetylmuramoyl-tripeptide:D-alanyl-D-alanine ligase/alanine racemase [Cytophagales bacterium]|nr:bifunctional UDP-N-acetylmuramoyl-tripeptide:D-alanyl-D-alanine ligase/alanine racemase [Cytophagales bacterium]